MIRSERDRVGLLKRELKEVQEMESDAGAEESQSQGEGVQDTEAVPGVAE